MLIEPDIEPGRLTDAMSPQVTYEADRRDVEYIDMDAPAEEGPAAVARARALLTRVGGPARQDAPPAG